MIVKTRTTVLIAAALVAFASAGLAVADHPEVEGANTVDACEVCHVDVSPKVVAEWHAGRHGANNVKCFICHGSTGEDFLAKPSDPMRCVGCHADQVADFDANENAPSCMSCHSPHLLSPHIKVAAADEGEDS